jgi:hypothetical protein
MNWFNIFVGLGMLMGLADLGFAVALLFASVNSSATYTLSPLVFVILVCCLFGVHLIAWGGSIWISYGDKKGQGGDLSIKFYTIHFFKCALGHCFGAVWALTIFLLNDTLYHFPEFILETDDTHLTIPDVIGEDIYYIMYRALIAFSMLVSLLNVTFVVGTVHDRRVATLLRVDRQYRAKSGNSLASISSLKR